MRIIGVFNKKTGFWDTVEFKDLKNDDIFRIFDNGERYVNPKDGNNVWIATSDPYQNIEGILTIDTLY